MKPILDKRTKIVERKKMLLRWRNWIIFLVHSGTISAGLVTAWLLRFDFSLPRLRLLLSAMAVLVVIRLGALYSYKLNHGYWRHTGIGDLKDLTKATLLGSVAFFVIVRGVAGIRAFPYSIYVLEGMLAFLLLAGLRVSVRMFFHARRMRSGLARMPVLIVGAGAAAALLIRELERTAYTAIGLVDDDPKRLGTKLCGVPVLGSIDRLPQLAHELTVGEIFIAIPSATSVELLRITDFCQRSGVAFRTLPGLADLIDGKVSFSELRNVNLEDLLGREPVKLNTENVQAKFNGRVVMVTGAAGSIGSELCRQIVRCRPQKLICVDQAETPLFNLQQHVLVNSNVEVVYSVTDITDSERMRQLLLEHDVRVIFHAAAYKHVPMTERNLYEGLKNNVFGLLDLVETAEQTKCEDFLLISTDKAVKPSSLMGCTKRLGEMIVGSRETSRMRCLSVRFGNVLGSQGSVIPMFQEQIRTRRCVTVTHPEMTRYFMTIPEAVSLVLQAFTVGEHGNVLVLDMGEPVRIVDLAKTLIRMSGKKENEIEIVYTGMRPGEKLHEELFYDSEVRLATPLAEVMRAQSNLPAWPVLIRRLRELQALAYNRNTELIRAKIKQIIPSYQWEPDSKTESAPLAAAFVEQHAHTGEAQQPTA
jgi:FlaA1/EpsC-like NDP-sugar epimerase